MIHQRYTHIYVWTSETLTVFGKSTGFPIRQNDLRVSAVIRSTTRCRCLIVLFAYYFQYRDYTSCGRLRKLYRAFVEQRRSWLAA
jgi:hypothetical protein